MGKLITTYRRRILSSLSSGTTKTIGKYSAWCQVFANIDDFNQFMKMANKQKDLYGNQFTYSLFDARAQRRAKRRRVIVGAAIVSVVLIVGTLIVLHKKGKLKF